MGDTGREMEQLEIRTGSPAQLESDVVAIPIDGGEDPESAAVRLDGWVEGAADSIRGWRRGGEPEMRLVRVGGPGPDLLAIPLADAELPAEERIRRAAGVAVRTARRERATSVAFAMPAGPPECWKSAAEGLSLGAWSYEDLRAEEAREKRPPELGAGILFRSEEAAPGTERAVEEGRILAEAQNAARRLVTLPGNVATPTYLAEQAIAVGERWGLGIQILGPDELRSGGFGALLAVSRGSAEEPRFIVFEHAGAGGDPLVIVGKGVTFDAGGISLKPAAGMEAMKYDMAGSAAVFGAMEAVARLDLRTRVVGIVAATENLPSGTAVKPGDVIKGLSGTSIEVVNTDAEGRLILSDALTFAQRLEPRAIVDLATLTGACVIALGSHAIGLMTPSDELAGALGRAGERSGERVWRLPLWKEYRKQLDSEIADLKNVGGREAGVITAGYFLREFAGEATWAHLDIAGTAWADEERGCQPKGATGVGVRLLVEWLRQVDAD